MKRSRAAIAITVACLAVISCGTNEATSHGDAEPVRSVAQAKTAKKPVHEIRSVNEFKGVIENAGARLLIFDLYADWCQPCRVLSPILEEIAKEQKARADFYKVNVDKLPAVAQAFGVQGLPFVVYMKNKAGVQSFVGVQSKGEYVRAINQFASDEDGEEPTGDAPDGELVEGVRVIRLTAAETPGHLGKILVYRGESVRLVIPKVDHEYSLHIPAFDVSQEGTSGQEMAIEFKAKDVGIFPIFCNGSCPVGDGAQFGQVVVMNYESKETEAAFAELSADQAKELIESGKALLVDVRTPSEYYAGHIAGAKLIPLGQISNRWTEIRDYKNKEILLYCRSGNRSVVASEVLIDKGFKKVYHLRPGIKGWTKAGYKVVKKG